MLRSTSDTAKCASSTIDNEWYYGAKYLVLRGYHQVPVRGQMHDPAGVRSFSCHSPAAEEGEEGTEYIR